MNNRIPFIDALRGLALVLMVQQHLQSWLWSGHWLSYSLAFQDHPIMVVLNFMGNFSAPLFLLLSGMGSTLYLSKDGNPGKILVKRGVFIILCGYLLNFMAPHWFSPGSWYVLHTIGFSIILSPLLNRMKTWHLVSLIVLIVLAPAFIQTWLGTPLMLGNDRMNNTSMAGGMARLIFAEGHFPLAPWAAFFIAGIVGSRWLNTGKSGNCAVSAFFFLASGIVLAGLSGHGYFFATGGLFFRVFLYLPYIYPPLPPLMCMLMGTGFLFLYIFSRLLNEKNLSMIMPLLWIGRSSFSWFFLHILIFNEISRFAGFYKIFPTWLTLVIIAGFTAGMIIISRIWAKADFRYGLEWLMRRIFGH